MRARLLILAGAALLFGGSFLTVVDLTESVTVLGPQKPDFTYTFWQFRISSDIQLAVVCALCAALAAAGRDGLPLVGAVGAVGAAIGLSTTPAEALLGIGDSETHFPYALVSLAGCALLAAGALTTARAVPRNRPEPGPAWILLGLVGLALPLTAILPISSEGPSQYDPFGVTDVMVLIGGAALVWAAVRRHVAAAVALGAACASYALAGSLDYLPASDNTLTGFIFSEPGAGAWVLACGLAPAALVAAVWTGRQEL